MNIITAELNKRVELLGAEIERLTRVRSLYEQISQLEESQVVTEFQSLNAFELDQVPVESPDGLAGQVQVDRRGEDGSVPRFSGNRSAFVREMIAMHPEGVTTREMIQALRSVGVEDGEATVYNLTSKMVRDKLATRDENGRYFPKSRGVVRRSNRGRS